MVIRILLLALCLVISVLSKAEFSGNIGIEGRYFVDDPLFAEQSEDFTGSISVQPEFRYQWNNGDNGFTFIPFARVDSEDDERTRADIRELYFLGVKDDWEWRIGVNKVFWGVLEFQHLVDIINQTDAVEKHRRRR